MISRKLFANLRSIAAALALFLPIIGAAEVGSFSNPSTQTANPQVLVFSDGGDDRTFGHATSDAAGNLYIPAELGNPHLTNTFGVIKYSAQGKLTGEFHFDPKSLGNGFAQDVKVDAAGNVYACGFTFPFGGLVISFDPSGKTRWTQIIGNDRLSSMVFDQSGNLYVGGDSAGRILVAKLTTGGTLLWRRQHQGATTAGAAVTSVQLDSKGELVVVGATGNSGFLLDTTVLKLDPQGHILLAQDFGEGPGFNTVPLGAALDHNDGIYATGTALNTFTGEAVPYTLKYDTNGNRQLVLTGAGNGGLAIAVDPAGDIVLHGSTLIQSTAVPTVSMIDPTGTSIFVTQIATSGALTVDSQGNIYVSGTSNTVEFQVVKLNSRGTVVSTVNQPVPNFQTIQGISDSILDPFGNLLVTGFGLPKGAGLDDILVFKLPTGSKPAADQ
jgi:hypothetical protein